MDPTSIGLLATAISAPITAAILKLVPQKGVKYDGPPTESLMTKEVCISHRNSIDARLTRAENDLTNIQNHIWQPTPKEPQK